MRYEQRITGTFVHTAGRLRRHRGRRDGTIESIAGRFAIGVGQKYSAEPKWETTRDGQDCGEEIATAPFLRAK